MKSPRVVSLTSERNTVLDVLAQCSDLADASIRTNLKLFREENGKRVIVTKEITIHESPTYNSYEPGTAAGGRSYYVVSEENPEWVQIRLKNGAIGYVNRRYIR